MLDDPILDGPLSPELRARIAAKVASGRFANADDVVLEALRLLDVDPSSSELATILEGIGEGFYAVDRDWTIILFNGACARHFGLRPEHALGRGLWEVFPDAHGTDLGRQFQAVMASRRPIIAEAASVVVPGRWLAYRLFPLGPGIGVVFHDVTDRKSAEEHRELLINELNHRVKNTLATVQSMAAQTLRNAGVDLGVQKALEARLMTLSNVHSVLTDEHWGSVELHDVARAALRPHEAPRRDRFKVDGPPLRLQPKSAMAISMALRELCTNAIKYGALSVDAGHVDVCWSVKGGRFNLLWRERGGPTVAPPGRRGFGSRLIERGLAAELRGRVTIDYDPDGVTCTVDAPMLAVGDESEPT